MKSKNKYILKYCFTALFLLFILPNVFSQSDNRKKMILCLNSYNPGYLWAENLTSGILENLSYENPDYDFYLEYMDSKNYEPALIFPDLAKLYGKKFSTRKPDVIIASDNNALSFLLEYRDNLFPDVPVVFCGINDFNDDMIQGFSRVTGVAEKLPFPPPYSWGFSCFRIPSISTAFPGVRKRPESISKSWKGSPGYLQIRFGL